MIRIKSEDLQNIFRIDKPKSAGGGATHAWQVRLYRASSRNTRFFSDSKFGSREAALAAARAYRDELYEELGIDTGRYVIRTELMATNSSGIIGVNRSESIEPNATIREWWQTAFPTPDHEVETKSFGINNRRGEISALSSAIEARMEGISMLIAVPDFKGSLQNIKILIDRYLKILIYLEHLTPTEEEFLIKTIRSKDIRNTDKEAIITGRVGQQTFKDKLVKLWGGRCVITGAQQLLNASHIKPWAASSNEERLDPFNGFLLSPSYNSAFDEGLISFTNDGEILISEALRPDADALGIRADARIQNVSPFSEPYLQYHRSKLFKGIGKTT